MIHARELQLKDLGPHDRRVRVLLESGLRVRRDVHHLNGNRLDDRIENLELWVTAQPTGVRITGIHCAGCTCDQAA